MSVPSRDPADHQHADETAAAHASVEGGADARDGVDLGADRGDDACAVPVHSQVLPPLPPRSASQDADGWLALPPRARWLYIVSTAIGLSATAFAASLVLLFTVLRGHAATVIPSALLLGALAGALYGNRRYINTRWRLDGDGFALRRGRLWQSDTRVPGSRVQHLDLKRGPVERLCGLATLVVHTAGTRHSAVALSGLDQADAERLRDALSRQTEDDDDG